MATSPVSQRSSNTSETDDMRPKTAYIFGKISPDDTAFPTLVVVTPTSDGWRARSTNRGYNHDYMCYESFGDVMEWIDADLHRAFIAQDRNDCIQTLVTNNDSEHRLGFLYPGDCGYGTVEEAEIAVSHLENGW